jgi:hypothetical protein
MTNVLHPVKNIAHTSYILRRQIRFVDVSTFT